MCGQPLTLPPTKALLCEYGTCPMDILALRHQMMTGWEGLWVRCVLPFYTSPSLQRISFCSHHGCYMPCGMVIFFKYRIMIPLVNVLNDENLKLQNKSCPKSWIHIRLLRCLLDSKPYEHDGTLLQCGTILFHVFYLKFQFYKFCKVIHYYGSDIWRM